MPTMPLGLVKGTQGLVKRAKRVRKVYRILLDWKKPLRGLVLNEVHTPGIVAVKRKVQLPHSKITPPYGRVRRHRTAGCPSCESDIAPLLTFNGVCAPTSCQA